MGTRVERARTSIQTERAERERVWNACSVVECGHNAARRVRAARAKKGLPPRNSRSRFQLNPRVSLLPTQAIDSSARSTIITM